MGERKEKQTNGGRRVSVKSVFSRSLCVIKSIEIKLFHCVLQQSYLLFIFCIFRFPKDEELRQKWSIALQRQNFVPSKSAVLCSQHFAEDVIDRTSLVSVRLREGAVPSIFPAFPKHKQPKAKKERKPPMDRVVYQNDSETSGESSAELSAQIPVVTDEPSPSAHQSSEASPETATLKRKLELAEEKLVSSRKKIKTLLQAKRRLKKKNAELKSVLDELRQTKLLGDSSIDVLETCASGVSDLLKRQIQKHHNKSWKAQYSPELRCFALTLHFYSPKAYNYIRKIFDTCLPHPSTVTKWYSAVDGKAGFTENSFEALKTMVQEEKKKGKNVVCSLTFDEIALRQQVDFDGKRNYGHIDMGTEMDDDSLPLAKEAFVFMLVGINSHWKMPLGYFFVDGLNAEEKKNLLLACLERLHNIAITVVAVTHDGQAANLSMLRLLGVCVDSDRSIKSHFPHPVTQEPVYVFLDACHMLKLVRNCLGSKGSMWAGSNIIKWQYIVDLQNLQDAESLHTGNKLKSTHIQWEKKKMNVKLAAQTLSESVATSLSFCLKEGFEVFRGCEETIKFITIFNGLFDILNSRNLKGYHLKAPLSERNVGNVLQFLTKAKAYILSLTDGKNGKPMTQSNRKTGFVGFLLCIDSLTALYSTLTTKFHMTFLLTYKFSQDHIELFFGKIRGMFGCNNNPSCKQFSDAYKKLLMHNEIQEVTRGNCLPLECVPVLHVSSGYMNNEKENIPSVSAINESGPKAMLVDDICTDHCYVSPSPSQLSDCSEKIVAYIAGFVVHKLRQSIHCEMCVGALSDVNSLKNRSICSLIDVKNRGALITPSSDVITICLVAEKNFRRTILPSQAQNMISNVQCHRLVQTTLEHLVGKDLFTSLLSHMFDQDPFNNHVVLLMKAVIEKYMQVRYYYAGRKYTLALKNKLSCRSRQTLTKLVLFSGQ